MQIYSPLKANVFDTLTNREMRILKGIIEGKSTTDIAEGLQLSPKTINSYHYIILRKTEATNDVELVLLALREGLIKRAS